MSVKILLAYDFPEEIKLLFSEYTDILIEGDPSFKEYLEGVASRITWGGGIFLAIISILPYVIFTSMGLPVYFGGTGIIIVVGVALDTIQQIDAHLVMRDYKGFI